MIRWLLPAVVLLLAGPAWGHGLALDVLPEQGWLSFEVYYPEDGKIAVGARITVTDAEARTLAEGTLDGAGRFGFEPREAQELKVVAEVAGHRARKIVARALVEQVVARDPQLPAKGRARSSRPPGGRFPVVEAFAGVAFLLAITSLLMALSLRKRVARLEADVHIDVDRYADLDSPIHRWDPRARVFSLMTLALAMAFTRSLGGAACALAIAVGVVLFARLPLWTIWWRMRWVFVILIGLATAVPAIGIELRSREELALWGVAVLLRGVAIVTMTLPVFGTSRVSETFAAFRSLGFPAKLATLILLAYRYLFVFREDHRRAVLAMRVRGYEARPGWHSFRTSTRLVGCLLVWSLERTERIYHAMQVRGFRGEFPWRREYHFGVGDGMLLVGSLLLVVVLLGGDVLWWHRY